MIDLFPSGPRDPQGIAQAIWDELVGESLGTRPADKLLTVAAYDAGDELTAYVDALAVGDLLRDAPLFLAPGWYVNVPLERTYTASWGVTPKPYATSSHRPRTAGAAAVSATNEEGGSAASLRSRVSPCLATGEKSADVVEGVGGPLRLPAKLHVSSSLPIKYRRRDLNPHPLARTGYWVRRLCRSCAIGNCGHA